MTATVIRADARHLPLDDNTVDLVVTSPPYFALRSYQDGGEHYAGQIGDEPTPAEFVASLLEVTRECVRVLKPSGSLWVNLGDKYATGRKRPTQSARPVSNGGARFKSLMGIPWRYALACIDDLGLILRAEVVWSKPNGLPESVTDRVRRSHEQWFHFTLSPRYYSAVDEIREPYTAPPARAQKSKATTAGAHRNPTTLLEHDLEHNPLGKLPGSVWTIPTEPLRVPDHLGVDHFAAFPTEWPRRIITGWSPAGVCTACGEGRRPVVDRPSPVGHVAVSVRDQEAAGVTVNGDTSQLRLSGGPRQRWKDANPDTIVGEACGCPDTSAPTRPAIVLDPFGGTGTTALVASVLGRHGITVDKSADYCRLAEWRTTDRNQRARILGIPRLEQPLAEQEALW